MISVKCECGYGTEVKDDFAGKSAKCPKCQKLIFIKPELPEVEVPESDFDSSLPTENYETKSGLKTAKREDVTDTDLNYTTARFAGLIDLVCGASIILAGLFAFGALVLIIKEDYVAGIALLASGLITSFWVYFASEICRVLAQIEKNTRPK